MNFSTTLLREKFIIRDTKVDGGEPLVALSNRMVITLLDQRGKVSETFIIRSQVMHTCIRMSAKIIQTYMRSGPIMVRDEKYDFAEAWHDIIQDHERQFNNQIWVAVYNAGKLIFNSNAHHAFLDIIENCESRNTTGNYDTSVFLAEEIFAAKGKAVSIEHQADTGMVLDVKKERARCGLILRSPTKRTNFNYIAEVKESETPLNPAQCLTIAAAFLEGIHLGFIIGRANERLRLNEISRYGEDDKKADSARRRLARLNAEIKTFEKHYEVNYRPERPEFPQVVIEAEKFTHDMWEMDQARKAREAALVEAEQEEDNDKPADQP